MKNLLSILLITNTFLISAQNVITRTFSSGYTTNEIPRLINEMSIKNDSTISYTNQQTLSGGNLDYVIDYSLRKSDLSIARRDTIWTAKNKNVRPFGNAQSQRIYAGYLPDTKTLGTLYNYEIYADSIDNQLFTIYGTQNNLRSDTLFALKFIERHLTSKPFVYDSMLYCHLTNKIRDTTFLEVYSMAGILLNQIFSTSNDSANFKIPFEYNGPAAVHPNNDSIVLFEEFGFDYSVLLVNRFTLKTTQKLKMTFIQSNNLVNRFLIGGLSPGTYSYDSVGYTVFGSLSKLPPGLIGNFYLKYGKLKFDWNGLFLGFEEYGEKDVYSRGYGYDKVGNDEYMVGSTPYYAPVAFLPEYRKILLFRESAYQLDSVLIFGQKNHAATNVLADKNGDVFIMSRFSNAWSDDSLFYEVTKVPGTILTSIKEQQFATSVQIYPNPTSQFLHSDEFTVGKEYQIYTSSGQIVLEGAIGSNQEVDVRSLKNGVYFIQLIDRGKQSHRSTVFIKD